MAKHLSFEKLIDYKFISQSAVEIIFKIGKHLAKLEANGVNCVICPFRLALLYSKMHNSPDKYNNLRLRTETVTNCCYVNRRINVSLLSTNIRLLWTYFDLLTNKLTSSVIDRLPIMYGILMRYLFLSYRFTSVFTVGHGILYMADVNIFCQ